jgi:AcrR family transcriptional regulator
VRVPEIKFVHRTKCVYTVRVKRLAKSAIHRLGPQRVRSTSTWDAIVRDGDDSGLTRERIVAAGIAIADQDGLAKVSVRRIAAHLDSSPMSLYHYVPSKRDLLNLMLDATNADFEWPAKTITDWRGVLCHFAWESRRCLKQHPWVNQLHAADPEYGPESIRILEWLLTRLSKVGLDVRAAIQIIRVLYVFVNGFVAAEGSGSSVRKGEGRRPSVNQPTFAKAILATGNYPNVARFIEMTAEIPDDQGFERALNLILNGVAAEIQSHERSFVAKQGKEA